MANNRKLQGEIDRLIKKVNEGMEVYDDLYEKVHDAGTQSLKEKHEGELKKEIKKLQRHREQIKTMIASPDTKDKKQLEQYRRFIEEKMESFKVCERETKTKTFSKEGLAARAAADDSPKGQSSKFLQEKINELGELLETLEFDMQATAGKKKGKRGKGGGEEDELTAKYNGVRTFQIKLEQVLRLLTNDEVDHSEVDDLEAEIQNNCDDFQDESNRGFDSSCLDLFEAFDLPEVQVKEESSEDEQEKPAPKKETPATPKAPEKSPTQEAAPQGGGKVVMKKEVAPAAPAAAKSAKKEPVAAVVAGKQAAPAATAAKTPASSPAIPSPKSQAAAAGGKTAVPAPASQKQPPQPQQSSLSAQEQEAMLMGGLEDDDALNDDTFGDDVMEGGGGLGGGSLAEMAGMTQKMMERSDWNKGRPDLFKDKNEPPKVDPSSLPSLPGSEPMQKQSQQKKGAAAAEKPAEQPPAATASATVAAPPASAKPATPPAATSSSAQQLFEMSFNNLPHAADSERVKPYVPPNPYKTPAFYPQNVHSGFTDPEVFSKLDPDTLFFIFYYQQQTYQQYLAGKELKRQSWRYHKKFHTWFQRHDKPQSTTEEYERGAYVYFDYENGWCQRIKTDFTFKYQYLEDELQ